MSRLIGIVAGEVTSKRMNGLYKLILRRTLVGTGKARFGVRGRIAMIARSCPDNYRSTKPRGESNMTVTVVARWTTPDIAAATATTKRAKAFWKKHGVQDVRLSQIFTGPCTGQFLVTMVYADMSAYAKVQAAGNADPEFQQIIAQIRKDGALIQEREILLGIDLS